MKSEAALCLFRHAFDQFPDLVQFCVIVNFFNILISILFQSLDLELGIFRAVKEIPLAKKKEAREEDIADAVDYVLTFQEVQDIFDAAGIQPELLSEDEKEHSSRAGRIYARTGGVSEAVKKTVEQIDPDKKIPVIPEQADGVPACKKLIERIQKGETEANFFEGMACNGGCVGGPKIIIKKEEGKERVDAYGDEAQYRTPLENPFVLELLERLGYDSVENFLENSKILTRDFGE